MSDSNEPLRRHRHRIRLPISPPGRTAQLLSSSPHQEDASLIGSFRFRMLREYFCRTHRADIYFCVVREQLLVPGHATLLCVASRAMERLCEEALASETRTVDVPDCSAADFLVALRFMYGDGEADMQRVDAANASAVAGLAERYGLDVLGALCSGVMGGF